MDNTTVINAILRNDRQFLRTAAKRLQEAARNIHECDCGYYGEMEDNGEHYRSVHYSVVCPQCGYSHDPNA